MFEFRVRDVKFSHVQSNSELSSGDPATSELVEVTEELTTTDALLRAASSNASNDVVEVFGCGAVLHGLVSGNARFGLGEEIPRVVEIAANSEEVGATINIIAEVNVVNFINVTLVHVSAQNAGGYRLGSFNAKQVEDSKELLLGDMSIASDIEILEDGLEVNASLFDGVNVLSHNVLNVNVGCSISKVLSASADGIARLDSVNTDVRVLVNASDGEGLVDASGESNVVEENLGVVSLVLVGKRLKFIFSQSEVHC